MEKQPRSPIAPGDVVGGKYRIERLLAEGGMGLVFVAHQERLNRRVAIKCLRPRVANRADALERFEREARAAASLHSDHVAKIIDVGQLKDDSPYLVMEFLEGEDLGEMLERCGRLPAEYATNILLDVCDAVGEAHGLGIVHRDLKPANIFIHRRANSTTVTKVLDFGISKVHVPNQQELTLTSAFMGSPRYMSPEQLRDPRNVTGRADIWALGVTLYELLTGVPPFVSNSFARMATLIMTVDPEPMRTKRVDLPEALDALVMRCLSKDPEARFATAQDLAAALRAVHFEAPEAAPPSSLPTPLEQQATHFAEVDQVAIPPAGTLLGLDSPKDLAQGRAEPSRLRVSLAVGAAILVGGAAFGATTLISSEAPSSLGSHGLPQPSSLGASAPPAAVVLVEAAAPPPPQTETDGPQSSASPANSALPSKPRRARMPVPSARPSDPFDLPLAR